MVFFKSLLSLLTISHSFLLVAMQENASILAHKTYVVKESNKTSRITTGQRRGLQRKRAAERKKELAVKQSHSKAIYDYFESQLNDQNISKESFQFFRKYVFYGAEKYNEFGILDKVLDAYFKANKITPNTLIIDPLDKKETSLFKFITDSASYGYKPAQILFEKLLERGGNPRLIIDGSSTIEIVEKRYNYFSSQDPLAIHMNEKNKKYTDQVTKSSQLVLQRLK